jgi:FG-GAP-like repeat
VTKMRKGGRSALAWTVKGLLLLAIAVVARAGLPLSFAPVVNVSLGPPDCTADVDCSAGALETAAGDFNNDGKLDIASANSASDDVTILLGDGHGGLTWHFSATATGGPAGIAAGKLNDDPALDLVVSKELDDTIGVFLGNGDGTFADEVTYDMGTSPEAVVLADFNNDTKLDVAVTDLFGETVSVRLGNGDGTFGELMQTVVAGAPYGMAAAKLDSDNNIDLAVSLYDDGLLATLFGQGDGTFVYGGTASAAILDDSPRGVALADFNHDGKVDAAVATESFDTVDVLFGNGDGTFQPLTPYIVGGFPESVAAGDYNGDGIIDLASADSFGVGDFDGSASVLVGKGDGTFQDAQSFEVDAGAFGITAADLNGDRLPDLVTANIDVATVSVLVNTICVGDCNNDGMVSIDELITGVNIALGSLPISSCPAFDQNGDGMVGINELITAVNNALNGCPA